MGVPLQVCFNTLAVFNRLQVYRFFTAAVFHVGLVHVAVRPFHYEPICKLNKPQASLLQRSDHDAVQHACVHSHRRVAGAPAGHAAVRIPSALVHHVRQPLLRGRLVCRFAPVRPDPLLQAPTCSCVEQDDWRPPARFPAWIVTTRQTAFVNRSQTITCLAGACTLC